MKFVCGGGDSSEQNLLLLSKRSRDALELSRNDYELLKDSLRTSSAPEAVTINARWRSRRGVMDGWREALQPRWHQSEVPSA